MTLGRCPFSIFCSRGTPPLSQPHPSLSAPGKRGICSRMACTCVVHVAIWPVHVLYTLFLVHTAILHTTRSRSRHKSRKRLGRAGQVLLAPCSVPERVFLEPGAADTYLHCVCLSSTQLFCYKLRSFTVSALRAWTVQIKISPE